MVKKLWTMTALSVVVVCRCVRDQHGVERAERRRQR